MAPATHEATSRGKSPPKALMLTAVNTKPGWISSTPPPTCARINPLGRNGGRIAQQLLSISTCGGPGQDGLFFSYARPGARLLSNRPHPHRTPAAAAHRPYALLSLLELAPTPALRLVLLATTTRVYRTATLFSHLAPEYLVEGGRNTMVHATDISDTFAARSISPGMAPRTLPLLGLWLSSNLRRCLPASAIIAPNHHLMPLTHPPPTSLDTYLGIGLLSLLWKRGIYVGLAGYWDVSRCRPQPLHRTCTWPRRLCDINVCGPWNGIWPR